MTVEVWKSVAPNKDWGFARYQHVANKLKSAGHRVMQFSFGDNNRAVRLRLDIKTSVQTSQQFRQRLRADIDKIEPDWTV